MDPILNPSHYVISTITSRERPEKALDCSSVILESRPTNWSGMRGAGEVAYSVGANAGSAVMSAASFLFGGKTTPEVPREPNEIEKEAIESGRSFIKTIAPEMDTTPRPPELKFLLPYDLPINISDINDFVYHSTCALINLRNRYSCPLNEVEVNQLKRYLINKYKELESSPHTCARQLPKIVKGYEKEILELLTPISKEEFLKEGHLLRGRNTPRILQTVLEVEREVIDEKASQISTDIAADYLQAVGLDEDAKMMTDYKGNRASETKSFREIAGKTINGWKHSIQHKDQILATVFRSGAFFVHSLYTHPIDKLLNFQKVEDKTALKLPKGFSQDNFDNLIQQKIHLTIAQGLSKIAASVKESAKNPKSLKNALKTGKFLHMEFGLLTAVINERRMVKDHRFVVNYLKNHLKIQLSKEERPLQIEENGDIIVTITNDFAGEDYLDKTFGVEVIFFNQGVNISQSGLNIVRSDEKIHGWNNDSLYQLLNYAHLVDDKTTKAKLVDFKEHFGEKGVREGKDLAGIDIMIDLVWALGGQVGVICKSGKDRTGMQLSRIFTNAFLKLGGKTDPETKAGIKNQFDESLSYHLTRENVGLKGFAFSGLVHSSLPEEMMPEWKLCRKAAAT